MPDVAEINICEFWEWTKGHYVEYTSETVNGKRLRFKMSLEGMFLVQHGSDTLYEGYNVTEAAMVYNNSRI